MIWTIYTRLSGTARKMEVPIGTKQRCQQKLKKSEEGYYYGVSKYLPYGTYVAVEQQPYSGALEDFKNQHYRIDQPKEIEVPSVYEAGGNLVSPEKKSADYQYDARHRRKRWRRTIRSG